MESLVFSCGAFSYSDGLMEKTARQAEDGKQLLSGFAHKA